MGLDINANGGVLDTESNVNPFDGSRLSGKKRTGFNTDGSLIVQPRLQDGPDAGISDLCSEMIERSKIAFERTLSPRTILEID